MSRHNITTDVSLPLDEVEHGVCVRLHAMIVSLARLAWPLAWPEATLRNR